MQFLGVVVGQTGGMLGAVKEGTEGRVGNEQWGWRSGSGLEEKKSKKIGLNVEKFSWNEPTGWKRRF